MIKKFKKYAFALLLSICLTFSLVACKDNGQVDPPVVEKYSITVPNVEHGKVTASATTVEKGESVELTVTPDTNYELDYLKTNGNALNVINNKAKIENVSEDQNVTAAFKGVEVTVTFVSNGNTVETKNVRYGDAYGQLPEASAPSGYNFQGWYTETNGAGSLVTAQTIVNNGSSHSVYAYYVQEVVDVQISGSVDRLVRLPGGSKETSTIAIVVTKDGVDVTDTVSVIVSSSKPEVVSVDGYTLTVADNADGYSVITVSIDGVEIKNFTVNAVDYQGLGYQAVSNLNEFKAKISF